MAEEGLGRFREIAEQEDEPAWQLHIADAAARLDATGLVTLLLEWASRPELSSSKRTSFDFRWGPICECLLADVLRAIGYLTRLLLDGDQPAEADAAVAFLHGYATHLAEAEDRSLVVGCTTALGYLGEWEPILTHLGPAEPWLYRAAHNVFANWVAEDLMERERAARWIARRLGRHRELAPEVRSTLGELLERLEWEIGRHVGAGEMEE